MATKNQIPQSQEAESSVLGSILIEPKKFLAVRGLIETGDFYNKNNGEIFQAMLGIAQKLPDKKVLGMQRSEQFLWETCGERHYEIIKELLNDA